MDMKKHILFLLCLIAVSSTRAQVFADHFADKTLRVDYIFNGNASGQAICLDGLSALPTWAGRKHHLAELPLQGNGQIIMRNAASGKTIYTTSFSSLFQEWLETDEAQNVTKGFENTFLLPYPLQPVEIEITLLDPRRNVRASMKHIVHPNDVLIEQKGNSHITPHKYLLHNDSPEKSEEIQSTDDMWTINEPMYWTINIYGSYDDYLESGKPFTLEQRYLNAICWYFAEVNNGGHHQFLYNSTGIVWEDALAGLRLFKMDELADNLQSVIDYFGGSVPFDRAERWIILQDWENEEELFDFLDKKDDVVYEYDGIYEDTFVHKHPELFVFDGTYTIPE